MLQNIAEKHGWHNLIGIQNYYNLLYREEEREMIPYCRKTGVGLIPSSPLARGRLARPYDSEKTGQPTHRESNDPWTRLLNLKGDADKAVTDRVEGFAKKKKVSMAMIATVWCLVKDNVNPIVGLGSIERIDQAVEAVRQTNTELLTPGDVEFLEALYQPKKIEGH